MKQLSIFLATLTVIFAAQAESRIPSAEEMCSETTQDEIECNRRFADRAETQLGKDFEYLTTLATSRNARSVMFFKMGHLAFKNYLQQNCESEGHDAFGGSLAEILEQKCRRDTILARRRLFEQIGERHPLGRGAEKLLGRPVCSVFADRSKPLEIGSMVNKSNVERLRKELDRIGAHAASGGNYQPAVAKLLRAVHEVAENQSLFDAEFTCVAIYEGFCPDFSVRSDWLSRCQTQLHGAFYKRATTRLRMLKDQ